jgi:hypothetical protein
MKKIITLMTAVLFFQFAHAQEWTKTIIGAKGGLNLANIGGQETDNAMKTSLHLGAYAEAYFLEFLNFQIELLLSGQGHAPKTDLDNRLNLTYLNVPLVAQYFPTEHFSLHFGPQFGFLMSAKSKYQNSTTDVKDFFKTFDMGLALGCGYRVRVIERTVSLNARYIHGITNVSTDATASRYNRVIQVSLAVMLFELLQ